MPRDGPKEIVEHKFANAHNESGLGYHGSRLGYVGSCLLRYQHFLVAPLDVFKIISLFPVN